MGKRSSAKKPKPRVKLTLDKTFKCMFCQHNGTITCKMQAFERTRNCKRANLDSNPDWSRSCPLSGFTVTTRPKSEGWIVKIVRNTLRPISIVRDSPKNPSQKRSDDASHLNPPLLFLTTDLTEPIDIYAEWIDACRAVNPEGARLQRRAQAPAVVRYNPTSTQATNVARGKKRRGSHDDDDEEEEEDEDEDDLPNPVGQRKKRRALDEDGDEEEDEQEEDQDLPEPVGKNRAGVPQQVEEEDGDDDEDLPEPQGRKNRPGVVVDDEEDE